MTTTPARDALVEVGDARSLPWGDGSVDCVVTSPPYWGQRDYGFPGQIGMEATYVAYIENMREVAAEVKRVLADDGSFWMVIGDTYNTRTVIRPSSHQGGLGHDSENLRLTWSEARDQGLVRYSARQPGLKDKDLMGLPFRVANAFANDGWFLRCDVIWSKPYGAPENAKDRPTRMHEYVFLFTKSNRNRFYKDRCTEAAKSVWEIAPGKGEEHRAVFPDEIVRRCLMLTTDPGHVVADPFAGSGTTPRVAREMGRIGLGLDGREW